MLDTECWGNSVTWTILGGLACLKGLLWSDPASSLLPLPPLVLSHLALCFRRLMLTSTPLHLLLLCLEILHLLSHLAHFPPIYSPRFCIIFSRDLL